MDLAHKAPFFEVAADQWAYYQTVEFDNYVEPEVFIYAYRDKPEYFTRAVNWSIARGYKCLRPHPEDAVKMRRTKKRV